MVKIDSQFRLSSGEQDFYAEHGYTLAKSVFSHDEAVQFRNEAHQIAHRLQEANTEGVSYEGWAAGAKITDLPRQLLQCHNVQYHFAAFTRLICDPRLTGRAPNIIGPNIQLHHSKMFIKPPAKGEPFPMHQDFPYFPHQLHTMIAAIIHFDDAPIEKGCVRVVPGSYKLGPLEHLHDGGHHLPIDEYPNHRSHPLPGRSWRRTLPQLPHHPRLRSQRKHRSAHYPTFAIGRSRRPAHRRDPRLPRPGHDPARYRSTGQLRTFAKLGTSPQSCTLNLSPSHIFQMTCYRDPHGSWDTASPASRLSLLGTA